MTKGLYFSQVSLGIGIIRICRMISGLKNINCTQVRCFFLKNIFKERKEMRERRDRREEGKEERKQ